MFSPLSFVLKSRVFRASARATLVALVAVTLVPVMPAPALAATWTVDTVNRAEGDIRWVWEQMKPSYDGPAHTVAPSVTAPYAAGVAAAGFVDDGLRMINFARYLAGLPADVVTTSALNNNAQHGAVLLAASNFSHTPDKPADMDDAFYTVGRSSTSSSNIGWGYSDAESFQKGCLADSGASNVVRVGHRRWLLNPPMKQTGIGFASNRLTTHVFDSSRTDTVVYDKIAWPAAGLFPVEFFGSNTPWSITLNPDRYSWDTDKTKHRVTVRRISDGRTWTLDANDTTTSGEYFNVDFSYIGVRNVFIFRPDPTSITYNPGDEFEVTLSGGVYTKSTGAPTTVTYRTRFMTLDGPIEWPEGVTVTEIAGANRISTAIEISQKAFPAGGVSTVVIATAYNWPDALGGAALAGALDAPILLTDPMTLPGTVTTELDRLGATSAIVLGGAGAVSSTVETALRNLLGRDNVTRISGADRYETSRKTAAVAVAALKAGPDGYDGTAFLATGLAFPDALGASPLSAAKGWPIYLVNPAGADAATTSAMKAAGVTHAIVLGGVGAVTAATETDVASALDSSTDRIAGANRYETAVKIASYGASECGLKWSQVAIATGTDFPDALAGGVLQGHSGSVMLLTPTSGLDSSAEAALRANKGTITEVRFLGGTSAISSSVRYSVAEALK